MIIQPNAFSGCTQLQKVVVPDSVTSIGYQVFENCTSLAEVIFPQGGCSLGHTAFKGCTALKSITIPEKVPAISSGMFSGCTSLETVTIPEYVNKIDSTAFSGCTKLKDIYFYGSKAQWEGMVSSTTTPECAKATVHYMQVITDGSRSGNTLNVNVSNHTEDKTVTYLVAALYRANGTYLRCEILSDVNLTHGNDRSFAFDQINWSQSSRVYLFALDEQFRPVGRRSKEITWPWFDQ